MREGHGIETKLGREMWREENTRNMTQNKTEEEEDELGCKWSNYRTRMWESVLQQSILCD